MKRILTLLAVILSLAASAQRDKAVNPLFSFALAPFSLMNNTVRIQLETSYWKKHPIFISVNPLFYYGSTGLYNDSRNIPPNDTMIRNSVDEISGSGIEGMVSFSKCIDTENLKFIYAGIGVGFHSIRLEFSDYDWEPYQKNGLEYYHYVNADHYEQIKRQDIFGIAGTKLYADRTIYFDLQMGIAYRNPSITSNLLTPRNRPGHFFDHGYSGFAYRFNVLIGLSLFGRQPSPISAVF